MNVCSRFGSFRNQLRRVIYKLGGKAHAVTQRGQHGYLLCHVDANGMGAADVGDRLHERADVQVHLHVDFVGVCRGTAGASGSRSARCGKATT